MAASIFASAASAAAATAASALSNIGGKGSALNAYTIHGGPSTSSSSGTGSGFGSSGGGAGGIGSGSGSSTPASTSVSSSSTTRKPIQIGLWRLVPLTHKSSHLPYTLWTFSHRTFLSSLSPSQKEIVLSVLRKEVKDLMRFRHPGILSVVEGLEEGRGEWWWVSEEVGGSLNGMIEKSERMSNRNGGSGGGSGNLSYRNGTNSMGTATADTMNGNSGDEEGLDEVEIQKGLLQIIAALGFLHKSKVVHLGLGAEGGVVVNGKGDWKLANLSFSLPLVNSEGAPTRPPFPEHTPSLPPQIQLNFESLDPYYAIDQTLSPSNDLYSLGVLIYRLSVGGGVPIRCGNDLGELRRSWEGTRGSEGEWKKGVKWNAASTETRDLVSRLVTRNPTNRITENSLPQHPYFRSLSVSILTYLEPTTFSSKSHEEKSTFLSGLIRQIPSFSHRLQVKKLLPSLMEQTRDVGLLGLLIPAIKEIGKVVEKGGKFEGAVMRPMVGLFGLVEPPQALTALLDMIPLAQEKAGRNAFQTTVMPLIYNALASEHPPVQEKALRIIPTIVDGLDFSVVQDILMVKTAILFSSTKLLAIKLGTLECFLALVPALDKAFLTTKLVPLLARMRTKEPTVMVATLRLHEAMGMKVDYTAAATLILPQLWTMSTAPTLGLEQYQHFTRVIKTLGDRVEREHTAHLRAAGQLHAQNSAGSLSSPMMDSWSVGTSADTPDMTFEKLLNGGIGGPSGTGSRSNGMDGGLLDRMQGMQMDAPWRSSHDGFSFGAPTAMSTPVAPSAPVQRTSARQAPPAPSAFLAMSPQPMQPISKPPTQSAPSRPNYNIGLPPLNSTANGLGHNVIPMGSPSIPNNRAVTLQSQATPYRTQSEPAPQPAQPAAVSNAPPGWNSGGGSMGIMQPTRATQSSTATMKNVDWSDFDPLK